MNVHTLGGGGRAAGAVVVPMLPAQATLVRPAATALAAPLPDLAHAGSPSGRGVPRPGVALALYGPLLLGPGPGFTWAAPASGR